MKKIFVTTETGIETRWIEETPEEMPDCAERTAENAPDATAEIVAPNSGITEA